MNAFLLTMAVSSAVGAFNDEPKIPQAIVAPPPQDLWTNRVVWSESQGADGYRVVQFNGPITNTYTTEETNIVITYRWPDTVERWFYYVIATNAWHDSLPSKVIHDPLYPNDRMTISGRLETSVDLRKWTFYTNGTITVTFGEQQRLWRGTNLNWYAWNPLNN